jgi:GNAT superfamily N-acetyltransferase
LKCEDADKISCVPCFYIKPSCRKKGVSTELLKAAVQKLAAEGETELEGYPVKPIKAGNKDIPGPFAFTGTIPLFEKLGFVLAGSSETSKLRYRKAL